MSDLIDRQAAIEALDKRFDSIPMEQTSEILMLRKDLRELPPTQLGTNLASLGTDCISRQQAIDAINRAVTKEAARWSVEELPSAEPKKIRGQWKYNAKIGTFKVWTCDQCGWNSEAEFNFCPNCGVNMRGEQE